MIIDEHFNRRVRIEAGPDEVCGYQVTVCEAETGAKIVNVACALIYLNPTKINEAVLTYWMTDSQGRIIAVDGGEPVMKQVHVERPEIAITAYETDKLKSLRDLANH